MGYDGFDVGLSTEGAFNLPAQLLSALLNLSFGGLKFLAEVSGSVVRWAVTLNSTTWFGSSVTDITEALHTAVGFGTTSSPAAFGGSIYRFILVCAVALIFWRLSRGDTTRAVTNLLITVLVLTVYLAWYQQSDGKSIGIAHGAITVAQQLGAGLAANIMGAHSAALPGNCTAEAQARANEIYAELNPGTDDEVRAAQAAAAAARNGVSAGCVIEASVRTTLVLPIYDLANWGENLGSQDDNDNPWKACAAIRDQLIDTGPHGNSDHPRDEMDTVDECKPLAEYQAKTDWNKFWITSMFGLFSVFMLLPALIIGIAAVWLGFRLVMIAIFVPHAEVSGWVWAEPPNGDGNRVGLWALGCGHCGTHDCEHVATTLRTLEDTLRSGPSAAVWAAAREDAEVALLGRARASAERHLAQRRQSPDQDRGAAVDRRVDAVLRDGPPRDRHRIPYLREDATGGLAAVTGHRWFQPEITFDLPNTAQKSACDPSGVTAALCEWVARLGFAGGVVVRWEWRGLGSRVNSGLFAGDGEGGSGPLTGAVGVVGEYPYAVAAGHKVVLGSGAGPGW